MDDFARSTDSKPSVTDIVPVVQPMYLWLLKKNKGPKSDKEREWSWDTDCNHGIVVRAHDEKHARRIASEHLNGDEQRYSKRKAWLLKKYSTCERILEDGPSGIILIDFNAG